MVYGIEEMVAAGVPPETFRTWVDFARGADGRLHALNGPHQGQHTSVRLDEVSERGLCGCARRRPTGDTVGALRTADTLHAALLDLEHAPVADAAHARFRWGLIGALDGLHEGHPPVLELAARLRRELAASLSERPAPTVAARRPWALAAAAVLLPARPEDLELPAVLRWPRSAHTGEEVSTLLRQDVAAHLEVGLAWEVAAAAAVTRMRADLGVGVSRIDAALQVAVEDYLRDWRTRLEAVLGEHDGRAVVVAVTDAGLPRHSKALARLLAPCPVAWSRQGTVVTASVPPVVAAALTRLVTRRSVDVAGPLRRGDTPDVLAALATTLEASPRTEPADALTAARAITAPAHRSR